MQFTDMDAKRKEFFNSHADTWMDTFYLDDATGSHNRYEQEFNRLFGTIGLKSGDTVVDMGCGCGVLVPYVLENIGEEGRLFEVDYAERMIEVNRRIHNDLRITYIQRSADDTGISCSIADSVICFSCFPHFHDKNEALKEIRRILKPGGVLVIAHFDSDENINRHHSKHECVMHDHLPSEAGMRELHDSAGFKIESFLNETGFYCIRAVSV